MHNVINCVVLRIAILVTALSACSDTDPKSRNFSPDQLSAEVTLDINAATSTANASGRLRSPQSGGFSPVPFPLTINGNGLIRLVNGDAFFIDWAGTSYQLYRRSREFVYQAGFALPDSRSLTARLGFAASSASQPVAVSAQLPDIASFDLLQNMQSVSSDNELDIVWNLNMDNGQSADKVTEIEVLAQPTTCTDSTGLAVPINSLQAVSTRFTANTESTTLVVAAADIMSTLDSNGLEVSQCSIDMQLLVKTVHQLVQQDGADMTLYVSTLSNSKSVSILDAQTIGATGTYQGAVR